MLVYVLLIISISKYIQACDTNCASCRDTNQNDTYCLACNSGYTQIQSGLCIIENTIPNCATYDQSLNCLTCKPTFYNIWNVCQRMFDGCLLYKNNKCVQCLPGGILNNNTGSCLVQYLNCIAINDQGLCIACQPKYTVSNGKCMYQSTNCAFVDKNIGLCTQCTFGSILLGTSCIPIKQSSTNLNCYLIDDSQVNVTCKYCKQGYGLYNGLCFTFESIINRTHSLASNCSDPQFLQSNQLDCLNLTSSMSNCQKIDFSILVCVFCISGFNLINGSCSLIVNSFCLTFDSNDSICKVCKPSFYLKKGQCNPYPPFCISYSNVCTQCQVNFQLVNGNCVDPNCQKINPITRSCQICVANYKINPLGVCKFIDPNCQQFNTDGDCTLCVKGYNIKNNLQYCVYQDLNCLIFDNITGNCNLCKPFFSYNGQVQLCIPLPNNCQTADLSGRCSNCMSGYNLISNYNCLYIPSIPNCQMISKDDYNKCVLCTNGSYATSNGVCNPLPVFCAVYDSINSQCQQCKDNGLMKNGYCVDKNCQIFDLEGGCLACISSYQFNSFGQCYFLAKDPSCKEFLYGLCKSCIERYYFDFQFKCTAVSPLCKTYDQNSGVCLSCYDGYQLIANGGCYLNIYNSVVGNNDLLSSSCKNYNSQGQCIECYFGYVGIPADSANITNVVNCVQNFQSINSYCINIDQNSGKCSQCVSRMFVNSSGSCQGIDQNCNQYNQSTGACIGCYTGYSKQIDPNMNRPKCVILSDSDPNCQIKANITGCIKCYSGYFYSLQSIKCVLVNQLCSTYNYSNGQCLSCYNGYNLLQGNCKLATPTSNNIKSQNNTQGTSSVTQMLPGCIQMNATVNHCKTCDWGYALIGGSCIQRDLNCQTFLNPNSLSCQTCYNGYKPFGVDQSKCVMSTLIIDHCLKYSSVIACILCQNGYILTATPAGTSPSFICNIIDQNCAVYNTTANQCQTCSEGTVLSGRFCIVPTYGTDQNCIFYSSKLCTACKAGWTLSGYLCIQP